MPVKSSVPVAICLAGPTASGKTALAMELFQRYPLRLINVDSAQVYRGLDIGTGKPSAIELEKAPHSLIDIRDPAEPYSASEFAKDALQEISLAHAAGQIPLLVGGTMLYFKVLRDGLAAMPDADPAIRSQIEEQAAEQGWDAVHARLAAVDPVAAERIHPNDPQRLQRALEVYLVSGRTLTDFHAEEAQGRALPQLEFRFFAIQPRERHVLHERIAARFQAMLEAGLVDEVRGLRERGDLHATLPSIKSVGYRQVWQHLEGKLSYEEMVEKSIIATRQLAKRQLTWLRSWRDLQILGGPTADSPADTIAESIENLLIKP